MTEAQLLSDGWIECHDVEPGTPALAHAANAIDHTAKHAEDDGWEADDLVTVTNAARGAVLRMVDGGAEAIMPDGSAIVFHEWASGHVSGYWWTRTAAEDGGRVAPSHVLAWIADAAQENYAHAVGELLGALADACVARPAWELARLARDVDTAARDAAIDPRHAVERLAAAAR
jgi:hypothetical protein